MKRLNGGCGVIESDNIKLDISKNITINPIRSLEDLSKELSEKLGKLVEVVDILQEHNFENYHSLVTGKNFITFLKNYEFNNKEYSQICVSSQKELNKIGSAYNVYSTVLVFKKI